MMQFPNRIILSKSRFIHVLSISSKRNGLVKTRSFSVNKGTTSPFLKAHHVRLPSVYVSSVLSSRQLLLLTSTAGQKALLGSWQRRSRFQPGGEDEIDSETTADTFLDVEDEVEGYFSKLYMDHQRGGRGARDNDDERLYEDGEMGEKSYSEKQYQMRQALLAQRGRLWSDPLEISDQDFTKSVWWDDIPDWSPDVVSSTSLERVKVLDHLPGLSELASKIALPPPPPVLPSSDPKSYVKHRKQTERQRIQAKVCQLAKDRVEEIIRIADDHEKQQAVDELFEYIEQQMREDKGVLLVKRSTKVRRRKSPPAKFEMMVEHALTEYLQEINRREEKAWLEAKNEVVDQPYTIQDVDVDSISNVSDGTETNITPLFVDLVKSTKKNIFAVSGIAGELKEDWELAALKSSQRVMLRKCMTDMAKEIWEKVAVEDKPFKIFIQGRKGVGKSSALTLLAAAARESGYIVLFLPDGDRYRKNGKYIEPCTIHKGMFNLPVLAKEMCQQLLEVHGEQLDSLSLCATSEHSLSFLGGKHRSSNSSKLTDLLRLGATDVTKASGCYSCVVATLMEQTEAPFIVFMDEYNTYFEKGEYFHEAYDSDVVHPIPFEKISFLQPFLSIGAKNESGSVNMMRRGGIVAAITYNRSVAKWATEGLIDRVSQETDVFVVDVPRYSKPEVEHVLANYECIGVGKLRFDNGKTISNDQEVEFLRMMSGAVGTKLRDATIWSMYA